MNESERNTIPDDVAKRLTGWFWTFWGFTLCHYFFGILGVAASAIAASGGGCWPAETWSIVAAVCIAIVGFVQPDRQYRKYVVAWRLLDAKASLYRHGFIGLKDLVEGKVYAEKALDQIERETVASHWANTDNAADLKEIK